MNMMYAEVHLNPRRDNKKKQEETTKERIRKPVTKRSEHQKTKKGC